MATTMLAAPAPTPKVSRYRSLRGKSVSESRRAIDDVFNQENEDGGSAIIYKTGSRHKRRSKSVATAEIVVPPIPAVPLVPALPLSDKQANILPRAVEGSRWSARGSLRDSDTLGSIPSKFPAPPPRILVATAITTERAVDPSFRLEQERREHEKRLLREETERRQRGEDEAVRWADEVARLEAETDRILAEQKKRDLARLQRQLTAQSPSLLQGKPKSPVLEKFAFLSRGRRSNAATLSPTSSTCDSVVWSRANSLEPNLLPRTFIEPRMVPQMDGVISSPNGTEREVKVLCRQLSMSLAVLENYTTVDVLFCCSDSMPHPINISCSIVLERYPQLGLERRLRRYERIRDVMNSWDRDTQNDLLVLSSDTFESDKDLDLSSVPTTEDPPQGFTLQLYYAQRPGKWTKRFITLRENGQMHASKKTTASPTDKDVQRLCHLSDFDIYTPTEAEMRKHLKPPKKYCYALKSQQKTTVFENTDNYVHFFSTEDPTVANKFHSLIHTWRSWYLVRRQVEVQQQFELKIQKERPPQIVSVRHKPKKSISHVKVNGHKVRVSVDESPYAIGEFQPLLDLNRFDKPIDDFGKDWVPDPRRSIQPPVPKLPPSVPRPERKPKARPQAVAAAELPVAWSAPPADGGAERKASTQAEKEGPPTTVDDPSTETPTTELPSFPASAITTPTEELPAAPQKPESPSWFPSAREHTARVRSQSFRHATRPSISAGVSSSSHPRRAKPSPLVSLTPKFQEAPQWSTEGRGHGVKAPPGMHLVDLATGHQGPPSTRYLEVPPRNLIRRDTKAAAAQRPGTSDGGGGRPRAKSSAGVGGGGRREEHPPVPPLPRMLSGGEAGAGARKGGGVERGRDPRPRALTQRGRSGTLR